MPLSASRGQVEGAFERYGPVLIVRFFFRAVAFAHSTCIFIALMFFPSKWMAAMISIVCYLPPLLVTFPMLRHMISGIQNATQPAKVDWIRVYLWTTLLAALVCFLAMIWIIRLDSTAHKSSYLILALSPSPMIGVCCVAYFIKRQFETRNARLWLESQQQHVSL